MEINIKSINDQMCRVHFAVKEDEVQDIYNRFCHSIDEINFENEKDLFKIFASSFIQDELLEMMLLRNNIVSLPLKEIRYFTDFKVGKMIMGVATFPKLPATLNLTLPKFVEYEDEENISSYVKERYKNALIENGMFNMIEINKVKKDSLIKYDINYLKDNVVINTLENQEFDMNYDDDVDPVLFLGAKKGDIIILDEDEINTQAVIKSIYEKKPYAEEDFDSNKLKEYGFNSYNEFFETYDDYARAEIIAEKTVDIVIEHILQNSNLEFSDELLSFYMRMTNKDISECKKSITISYFSRIIDIQQDFKFEEEDISYILEMINFLNLEKNYFEILSDDMSIKMDQYKIIKVLYNNGVLLDPIF